MSHCCEQMERAIVDTIGKLPGASITPDFIISYTEVYDEYGIIIHDGGSSSIGINYCPFCGTKLPESKRDLWFDTLEKIGYEDPSEQNIPDEFKSNAWYKNT